MTEPEESLSRSLKLRTSPSCRLRGGAQALFLAALLVTFPGCSSDAPADAAGHGGSRRGASGRGHSGGFGGNGGFGAAPERGVPVEVSRASRSPISLFFETQGTLEAEREVDLLARVAGPIVELATEEGQRVRKGQLLARIDDRELKAQLGVAEVRLEETRLTYERSKNLSDGGLVSQETVDQALASFQSAQGDYERIKVQLLYTEVRAPFSGLVINRYVKYAQTLSVNSPVFRISDFDPLLCPIQVPERELPRLRIGQPAQVEVEAWPEERFEAKVLRVSPVVEPATGTFKVTLEVDGSRLRPGMFASVYLEMESKDDALVIPKRALALDSLDDSVFVVADGAAQRRTLKLGFQNSEQLEVLEGLEEGEEIVVVGQDNLSEGTPVDILGGKGSPPTTPGGPSDEASALAEVPSSEAPGRGGPSPGRSPQAASGESGSSPGMEAPSSGPRPGGFLGPGGRGLDLDDPEQVERIRRRMKERGLSDEEIDQRLQRMRERSQ